MILVSNELSEEWTQIEKWYGTQYISKPLDSTFLASLENGAPIPGVRLPSLNPFIAKNFDVEKFKVETVRNL